MEVQTLGNWARSKLVSHHETWSPKFIELLRVFGILLMILVVGGGLGIGQGLSLKIDCRHWSHEKWQLFEA